MEQTRAEMERDFARMANEDPDRHACDDLQPDIGNFSGEKPTLHCTCGRWQWDRILQRWCIPRLRLVKLAVTCEVCRDSMAVVIDDDEDVGTTVPLLTRAKEQTDG